MSNIFVALPTIAGNLPGAAVDVSMFGSTKTVTVTGLGGANVAIEVSCDPGALQWQRVALFQQSSEQTLEVACHWMRAVVSSYVAGPAPAVELGGTDDGTLLAALAIPAGNGAGAPTDVSPLGIFKTVQVGGSFTGVVTVEVSEDGGVTWATAFSFPSSGGVQSQVIAANRMRVVRSGVTTANPGAPSVNVAGVIPGGPPPVGPWTRTGTVIHETVPTDQVVVGAAAPPVGDTAPFHVEGNASFGSPTNPIAQIFVNQIANFNSNAGIQHSSLVANRAQYRGNQFGANTGVPGVTAFKSRGLNVGDLAAVIAGDVLFRATAIGVAGNNVDIPLAGFISINAALVAANYVATDFEVQLVQLAGPINTGRKQAFVVDSEGILHLTESPNKMAGLAVLDGAGQAIVNNTRVKATTKFQLTAQDGGTLPVTGSVYQAARVVGTSFTIKSTAGAADAGVQVYYQLFEPTIP